MARPREFDEETVIAAARDRFWTTGYAATSMDDLCAATGLGKGSLYGAFTDKHGLFLRALDRYSADQVASFKAALEGDEAGALQRLIRHVDEVAAHCAGDARGCLLGNAVSERGQIDPEVNQRARTTYGAWERLLATCVRQAQVAGDIDPKIDPDTAAAVGLNAFRGMVALGQIGKGDTFMRAVADAALAALADVRRNDDSPTKHQQAPSAADSR